MARMGGWVGARARARSAPAGRCGGWGERRKRREEEEERRRRKRGEVSPEKPAAGEL